MLIELCMQFLTDAGQYVIQFGHADPLSKTGPVSAVSSILIILIVFPLIILLTIFMHSFQIQELEISRPLTLSERAVAIALAVSLDSDYFSRRRRG